MRFSGYLLTLFMLSISFAAYNGILYSNDALYGSVRLSGRAMEGQRIWQANNCSACHQLYGLGGYLGPDLTNVCSAPGKGPAYVRAMVTGGMKSMPLFEFTEAQKDALTAFLEDVDRTGTFPNRTAVTHADGWVEMQQP